MSELKLRPPSRVAGLEALRDSRQTQYRKPQGRLKAARPGLQMTKAEGNPPFAIYSDAQAELALGREGWGTRKTEREAQAGMPAPRKDGDAKKAPGPPTESVGAALGYK